MSEIKQWVISAANTYYSEVKTMCCEPRGYKPEEINGECPDCGADTVDGDAYEKCCYSPKTCETCGRKPCDGSC